jgi:hypothetical protein
MPRPNLSAMSVDALLKLREDIGRALDRKANELRGQLSMLGRPAIQRGSRLKWPAPGSEDTELGVLMELEVGHGETEVYARVQA